MILVLYFIQTVRQSYIITILKHLKLFLQELLLQVNLGLALSTFTEVGNLYGTGGTRLLIENGDTASATLKLKNTVSEWGVYAQNSLFGIYDYETSTTRFAIADVTGNIGIGTTSGLSKLSINGGLHVGGDSDAGDNNLLVDGTTSSTQYTSTIATGNPPLVVASTTKVTNLYSARAELADTITVVDTTDSECFIAMFDAATGNMAIKTDTGFKYDASTGNLTVTGTITASNFILSGS